MPFQQGNLYLDDEFVWSESAEDNPKTIVKIPLAHVDSFESRTYHFSVLVYLGIMVLFLTFFLFFYDVLTLTMAITFILLGAGVSIAGLVITQERIVINSTTTTISETMTGTHTFVRRLEKHIRTHRMSAQSTNAKN